MALITPPFAFAHCTDTFSGRPAATDHGVAFTVAATGGEGTAVDLISSVAHDVHFIILGINGCFSSGADIDAVGDLLIDRAGGTSYSEFIPNLVCGFGNTVSASSGLRFFYFPIWAPAGSSFGFRAKNTSATAPTTGRVGLYLFGEPNRPDMWWCGQGVEALGVTEDSAHGARVTPGNSGSFGSWTSIGSPTTYRYGALQIGIGPSDSNATAIGYHWEMGYGDTRLPGSPAIYSCNQTTESGQRLYPGPIWCDIPAGTQMQVRGKASGSAEQHDIALYGVY